MEHENRLQIRPLKGKIITKQTVGDVFHYIAQNRLENHISYNDGHSAWTRLCNSFTLRYLGLHNSQY